MNREEIMVSICIPVYGVEKYVERCAISVFEQTYRNIEYIFVNDCTPDRSMEVLEKVIERYPQRQDQVRIINHKRNRGLSASRNTALKYASGLYICWVDYDDYIEANMIEKMIDRQMSTNADIVSCNSIVHFPDRESILSSPTYSNSRTMALTLLRKRVPVSVWGRIIRRQLYVDNGICPLEGLNVGEDFQVMPILAYYARTVSSIEDCLYHYNCENNYSYTHCFSPQKSEEAWRSLILIYDFFIGKGPDYIDALEEAKVWMLINSLIECCTCNEKEYFIILQKRVEELCVSCMRRVPIEYYILLKCSRSYYFTKFYIWFGRAIKKMRAKLHIADW